MQRIRAITLDLDNTLWPVWPVIEAAERDTMDWFRAHAPSVATKHSIGSLRTVRADIAEERPDIAHDMGALRHAVFAKVVAEEGYPETVAKRAYDVFYESRCRVEPYSEVKAVLGGWVSRYVLAALTNGNADIQRTSLAGVLTEAVRAGDVGFAKPDTRIFALTCSRLGVSPGETVHVGDHPVEDIEGARAAGLECIWMNRSGQPWPLDTPEPLTATNLQQAEALIAKF